MIRLHPINILSLGAIPNDSSQSARAANAQAWRDAMDAMGTPGAPVGHTLVISGGDFYFPGPVFMNRPCILQGEGGSFNSTSKLYFPYNGAGIVVASSKPGPDGPGNAQWGKIENLDIINEGPHSIVQRRLNWKYHPGDIVISTGNGGVMFLCTAGGVTVDPPAAFDSAAAGSTVQENNGTAWLALTKTPLAISVWQQDTQYHAGDIVVSGGFDLAGQHYGDSRFAYVCTVPGTSIKGADPFGSQVLDTTVAETDPGDDPDDPNTPPRPVWRVSVWSAIVMRASIHVDNVATYRWPNAAIHISAGIDVDQCDANNFVLTNIKSNNDGMGIYVYGADTNVGFVGYCQVLGPGCFTPGRGGHGFWDHSSCGGGLWINNYAQDGTGAGWISDAVGKTTWINNLAEMPVPNVVRQGIVTSMGTSGWHPTMLQHVSHLDPTDGRGIATTDCTNRVTVFTRRGSEGYIDTFSTTDEQNNYIGRIYSYDSWRRGWYTDHYAGQNTAFIGGVSGLIAAEGPGHAWTAAGTFVGPYTSKRYFGYDPEMWTSNRLREGKRIAGDVFITEPKAGPGKWMGIVVTQDGTKGVKWAPGQLYAQKRGQWNLPATVIEPGDGFAYACTRSGTSGPGPQGPQFSQNAGIGVNAPVWTAGDRCWPGWKVRPTKGNGHYYQMKQYPAWTKETDISANQITASGDLNGNLFYAWVQPWSANTPIQVGARMQPTIPDGRVFRVKRVTGITAISGNTGNTGPANPNPPPGKGPDPDWSQLVSDDDELTDGSVVWQLEHLKTGQMEPPGIDAMHAGWDTRPNGVTYDNNIEWRHFDPAAGGAEPVWKTAAGSETTDTPGAKIKSDGTVEPGFGVVWVESGPDPDNSKILENSGCEWTRIDKVPVVAKVFPVAEASPAAPMSLTLNRLTLQNVDDAAGRWQFEGGKVFQHNKYIADYASTKRVVMNGTTPQNTAMLTLTLFFIGQPQHAPENMTLQGSHDFHSGSKTGSVSAASPAFASHIGKTFALTGPGHTLIIQ